MRRYVTILVAFICIFAVPAAEMEIKLIDGTTVKGELTAPNDIGVVIKVGGRFQPRTAWTKISPETLRELQKDPAYNKYVNLMVIPDAAPVAVEGADKSKAKKKAPTFKNPEHPARLLPKPSLIAGIFTPLGFLVFLSLYGTNVYAAYEVARFRGYPWKLACGVAAVAPVIGPIVFLCLKTREEPLPEVYREIVDRDAMPGGAGAAAPAGGHVIPAAPVPETPVIPQTQIFKRGEFTFNRRFIETKFAGFFRLVPSEADKDMKLVFVTARGEYAGRRIGKVTQNDLQLVVQKDDAFVEVTFPLNDILEVQVRHKDS